MPAVIPISLRIIPDRAFAFVACIIMVVAIFYLKLSADATLFARDGRIAPAFFFFGDSITLSKRVQTLYKNSSSEGFESASTLPPSLESIDAYANELYTNMSATFLNWIGTTVDHIIIPLFKKYTYI